MDVDEILDIPKDELKANTTKRLLEHLEELEQHALNEIGELDMEKVWDYDESLGNQMFRIQQILRDDRLEVSHHSRIDENQERIERLEEEADGMQKAIDDLKVHGHDCGVETHSVNYPGKRE